MPRARRACLQAMTTWESTSSIVDGCGMKQLMKTGDADVVGDAQRAMQRTQVTMAEMRVMKSVKTSKVPGSRLEHLAAQWADDRSGNLWTDIGMPIIAYLTGKRWLEEGEGGHLVVVATGAADKGKDSKKSKRDKDSKKEKKEKTVKTT